MNDQQWQTVLRAVNEYSMHVFDASEHKSASKADIARSSALAALGRLRAAIEEVATPAEPVAPGGVPSGWALVPIEPTREMMEASATCRPALKPSDLPLKQAGWSLGAIMDRHRYVAAIGASAKHIGPHTDDIAVDKFAAAMKEKLAEARAKGRGGWETCPRDELARMLREHVEKGDPRDVANFCMFLWHLGGSTAEPLIRVGQSSKTAPKLTAGVVEAAMTLRKWADASDLNEGWHIAHIGDVRSAPPAPASEAPREVVLPSLPFAVFDEFGKPADDRVQDYGKQCAEAAKGRG